MTQRGRILVLLALCGAAPPAAAQQGTPAASENGAAVQRTAAGVRLDFQDADLRAVISTLAELAGMNLVFSNLPTRTVTLRTSAPASPAEVRRFLESICRAHGLEVVEENGLFRIEGGAEAAEPGAPQVQVRGPQAAAGGPIRLFVHRLKHARAESLAGTISNLFGVAGAPLAGDWQPTRSLSQELRAQQLPPVQPGDVANPEASAQRPQPAAPGGGLAAGLQGPVTIVPDPRTNALLVRARPADYETIRAAIDALDARPLQVLIEVLIAEVRRRSQFGLGVSVEVPDNTDSQTGITLGGSLAGTAVGNLMLSAAGIGGIRADVLLHALAEDGDVTILSRPVLLAQNNQQARILVGSERPFIQLFRALPTDAAVRDQVVQYRDVGTQLTIRPTINPDGYVNLSVLQEVSTATAETQFGAPVISTREAETELLVRDGHTAVIGGLIDRQHDRTRSGIPLLKDIPVLGAAFRSSQDREELTELFLFITPHVVASDEELDETSRALRERTSELRERLPEPIPLLQPTDSVPPAPAQKKETGSGARR